MIKLTKIDGTAIFVSPEHLTAVEFVGKGDGETWIYTVESDQAAKVQESPEEVARKVLEYRLAMERYKAAMTQSELTDPKYLSLREEAKLYELSGLSAEKGAEGYE